MIRKLKDQGVAKLNPLIRKYRAPWAACTLSNADGENPLFQDAVWPLSTNWRKKNDEVQTNNKVNVDSRRSLNGSLEHQSRYEYCVTCLTYATEFDYVMQLDLWCESAPGILKFFFLERKPHWASPRIICINPTQPSFEEPAEYNGVEKNLKVIRPTVCQSVRRKSTSWIKATDRCRAARRCLTE